VAEDRRGRLRLVAQAEGEVGLDQPVQRLGRVAGGLEILDHHAEAVDRGG
jgi:hypothetical protein